MKKLLIVLLALTVLGVFAFAQDEAAPAVQIKDTFGAGGLYLTSNATGANPDVLSAFDYWNQGVALWNTVDLSYASGDFTFFGEWGGEMAAAYTSKIGDWRGLSMKGKFFGGMLAAEVGKTNNGDFTSLGDAAANNWGTGSGFLGGIITASPIPGLTVGFGLPLTSAGRTLLNSVNGSQIGLAYSMDKMFVVKAEYLLNDPTAATKLAKFNASFALNAVENLTFNAEAWMSNIGDTTTSANSFNKFDVTAAYTMGALTPGVVAYATMWSASGSGVDWNVKPYVNYTIDKTTLTGNFKYSNKVAAGSTVAVNTYTIQALAKQAFDAHATAWVGIEYGDSAIAPVAPAVDVATFKVALSVAYAF